MKRNKEDVLRAIKEEHVKSIRLAFCDVYGREKNITVTPDELTEKIEPAKRLIDAIAAMID